MALEFFKQIMDNVKKETSAFDKYQKDEEYTYPTEESDYEAGGEVAAVKAQKEKTTPLDLEAEQADIEAKAKAEREAEEAETDKKIANIKKILGAFQDDSDDFKAIKTKDIVNVPSTNLNLSAPDIGSAMAKQYASELIQQPSSQRDRVSLLYEDLKRLGLT